MTHKFRHLDGRYRRCGERERATPPLLRKMPSARSEAVAKGNKTRRSNERRAALAMFGVALERVH